MGAHSVIEWKEIYRANKTSPDISTQISKQCRNVGVLTKDDDRDLEFDIPFHFLKIKTAFSQNKMKRK